MRSWNPPDQTQSELDSLIFTIHEAGFQVGVHSNGDREITMLLEAFEKTFPSALVRVTML